ncbi:MAG: membrane-bound lytic murein transglycosylase MltF [Gammaproteobacteria bacterium]|nr:membrane-bound lytic murein transglycosylase MltF [Gammaproteobacteria bacterium]
MHKRPVIGDVRILLALSCIALAACSGGYKSHSLEAIKDRGTLVVLTRNAPTTYYIDNRGQATGPEYQMAVAFADYLGVKPKFVVKDSVSDLLYALAHGQGDMIAGGITRTAKRLEHFDFGPVYHTVTQEVVCGSGSNPDSVDELHSFHLKVIADSSYVQRLKQLKEKYAKLHWTTTHTMNTEALLRQVWAGQLDCTVADSTIVAINRRYFPNLDAEFAISEPQPLAWVIPEHGAQSLREAMKQWLHEYKSSGALENLMERYYSHVQIFDFVGVRAFKRKIESAWPKYRSVFHEAAEQNDLPPLILAAMAYQESHWNPHAESPTGVRGMMMLTLDTAEEFGVENRLDPVQSIRGGARYLAFLEGRLEEDGVPGRARLWFALAAYNIGYYHVRDARRLARKLGKNEDSWYAVSKVLPLLSERRYYKHLPYGYARGTVAVRYVRRIRNYADILRLEIRNNPGR